MYELIQISKINDFLFCPYSIYIHAIYENFNTDLYHEKYQKQGKISHDNVDSQKYSSSKNILQGQPIYSQKYKLIGKFDIYDKKNKYLIERKYKVSKIHVGYIYQLYAEMLCLCEMGYEVKKMFIHSLSQNQRYEIDLPTREQKQMFKDLIDSIWGFDPHQFKSPDNPIKCTKCIYNVLCDKYVDSS
ncbi:MAG TPA: type V CRISPR-associated protein Cas4 [Candidatus Dojkabacteria bacterium]|nr:type V CRISPR-associated protein Cas4 [Candidatus Dojkabacteria bacterium]